MPLQAVANNLLKELDDEINLVGKLIKENNLEEADFKFIPCSCMGDWCRSPFLHGANLNGKTLISYLRINK